MRLVILSRTFSAAATCLTLAMALPATAQDSDPGSSTVRFASATAPAEDAPPATPDAPPSTDAAANSTDDPAPQFWPSAADRPAPQPVQPNAAGPKPPAVRRVGTPAPIYAGPSNDPKITSQTRRALGFYGGSAARQALHEMPARTPVESLPRQPMANRAGKPFQARRDEPTVSPYLNLYRDEERGAGIPNYFTYVRPQLEQLEANRSQQRDLQQLRGQLQAASAAGGPQFGGQRTAARYMDTAQFYHGRPR